MTTKLELTLAATLSKGMAFLAICGSILTSCKKDDDDYDVPTSCWVRRTSSKPSMLWSRPWRTAPSPNSASTRACAAS